MIMSQKIKDKIYVLVQRTHYGNLSQRDASNHIYDLVKYFEHDNSRVRKREQKLKNILINRRSSFDVSEWIKIKDILNIQE